MWPFSEMSLGTANFVSNIANIVLLASLVVGVIATFCIFHTGTVKERYWDEARQASDAEIAKSTARAATAVAVAAEAELKLAEFRKPRLLEPDQISFLIDRLKPFAGTKIDIGHPNQDREVWDFLWRFEPVFPEAGWLHIDWRGGTTFKKSNWPGDHVYGSIAVINISIEWHAQNRDQLLPAATALVNALNEIGIEATVAGFNNSSMNADAVHFLVGAKR